MITAKQIRQTRLRLNETPGVFAKHFGVARTTILHWENGNPPKFGPTVQHVERVLAELAFAFAKHQRARAAAE
jgi:DNA-binding XRE family transcriptional regulator